jgi:hypothetical protein
MMQIRKRGQILMVILVLALLAKTALHAIPPQNPGEDQDPDGDGLSDLQESGIGTDPLDADSDDDGLSDGDEHNGEGILLDLTRHLGWSTHEDFRIKTNPLKPDTDEDGIPDGTEAGVTVPIAGTFTGNDALGLPAPTFDVLIVKPREDAPEDEWEESPIGVMLPPMVTLLSASHLSFVPDADPRVRTNPKVADTNGDTIHDGLHDLNYNGKVDDGESDPVLGIYVQDPWAPNKVETGAIYVARRDSSTEALRHPGGWGDLLDYWFDFGSSDFDEVRFIPEKPLISFHPSRLTRDKHGQRLTVTVKSNSSEPIGSVKVKIELYKSGELKRTLQKTAFISGAKPLPYPGYEEK